MDKENNNDPLKIWGLYLFVLAFPGECVNQLGSEVKSIPERSARWFKTLDVWHRLMLCDIKKKKFFLDMKFGINQAISQTITQLSCIQLETPSSRLWNFWWIKTYTTFNLCFFVFFLIAKVIFWMIFLDWYLAQFVKKKFISFFLTKCLLLFLSLFSWW